MANDITRRILARGGPLLGTRSTASAEAARDGKRGAPCNTPSPFSVRRRGLATRARLSLSTPTTPTTLRVDYPASLRALGFGLSSGVRVDKLKQSSVTPSPVTHTVRRVVFYVYVFKCAGLVTASAFAAVCVRDPLQQPSAHHHCG